MIVVNELAIELEHVGPAEAADTAAAQVGNLHARGLDRLEEALVWNNMYVYTGLRQVHVERLAGRGRTELLPVNVTLGPPPRARLSQHDLDHACRPADIEMGSERRCGEDPIEIDCVAAAVVIQLEPIGGTLLETGQECGVLRSAHAVVNLVRHSVLVQIFHLPQDRCDPDATGDQDVLAPNLAQAE